MRGYVGQDHQLASNVTALHQPLDMGIISAFKNVYKASLLQEHYKILSNMEAFVSLRANPDKKKFGISAGKPASILDAMELASQA